MHTKEITKKDKRNSKGNRNPPPTPARRSWIVNRLFPLPASFHTSAHRIVCYAFHSEHTLKRWTAPASYTSTTSTI